MQMKDHVSIIRQAWLFVLLFGVVVAAVTYGIAVKRPPMYAVVQSYEVGLINRPTTPDYQYGSYYDLKGAELFTQHVMSMLRSPAVIGEIYEAADLGYTIDDLSRFTSQFRTDQGSSQEFTVQFSRYTADEGKALANAMTTVLSAHVAAAETNLDGDSLFTLHADQPVIVYQETNVWLVTVTALVAGWILAIVLVYVRRYLQ